MTVFIPTWNAGPEFPGILRAILGQQIDRPMEVLVIDSGSTDGTVELLRRQPVRLIEIPQSEFNHGLTRARAVGEATGDLVAFVTQDARPSDPHWLQRLVDCFDDPVVAGAYSCQLPRPDANPFIKHRLSQWAASQTERRIQHVESPEVFEALAPLEKLGRVAFDNVSSAVRRRDALEIPFRRRQFGEDIDWARRVVLAGRSIVFEPGSKVVHSHNRSIWYEFKRVYLDHQNLQRQFGVMTLPRRQDILICSRMAIAELRGIVDQAEDLGPLARVWWKLKAVPFGFTQNLAQFLGARSVLKLERGSLAYRLLDWVLRRGV